MFPIINLIERTGDTGVLPLGDQEPGDGLGRQAYCRSERLRGIPVHSHPANAKTLGLDHLRDRSQDGGLP